jgi:glyoxylase-like metal-dependent hydrolase (beta-lactamase superfamily II)
VELIPLDDEGSFAWLAGDWMDRASTALAVEGGHLLVDPVWREGLPLERVVGVVTLIARHERDAARFGAPRLERVELPGVEHRRVRPGETMLWLPERRLLVCGEALGTGRFFYPPGLGLHPFARLRRLRAFDRLEPVTIAVGHGPPVRENAAKLLEQALRHPWRDLPRGWLSMVRAYRASERSR